MSCVKCNDQTLTSAILSGSTDIVIPGANSTTDVQARISAGESIHVIRGSKGSCNNTLIALCTQSTLSYCLHHLVFSPPQVPTLGRTMEEFLLFDLERSVDQQSGALLLQAVQIHIYCSRFLLHSFALYNNSYNFEGGVLLHMKFRV